MHKVAPGYLYREDQMSNVAAFTRPDRIKCPAAASYIGLTASALEKMRCEGRGPRYLKIGNRVF